MKKILTLVMCTFMLVVTLTSCVAEDIGITLNSDGTGKLALTMGIKEDYYDMMPSADGEGIFEGKETSEVIIDGEKYIAITETTEYGSYEEIEQALLKLTYNTEEIEDAVDENAEDTEDTDETVDAELEEIPTNTEELPIFKSVEIEKNAGLFYTNYTFKAKLNPMPTSTEYDVNDMMKLSVTLEMPEEIAQASGGTVEGKTVTFNIEDLTNETELSAACEANNYVVIISIVVVLLLVLGLFFFLTKKKD